MTPFPETVSDPSQPLVESPSLSRPRRVNVTHGVILAK